MLCLALDLHFALDHGTHLIRWIADSTKISAVLHSVLEHQLCHIMQVLVRHGSK